MVEHLLLGVSQKKWRCCPEEGDEKNARTSFVISSSICPPLSSSVNIGGANFVFIG